MPVRGPTLRTVEARVRLPAPPSATPRIAGGATCEDGTLRVVRNSVVFAIRDAAIIWRCDTRELGIQVDRDLADPKTGQPYTGPDAPQPSSLPCSLPSILSGNRTLVTVGSHAVVLAPDGALQARVEVPMADDSGPATNTDPDGSPVFTTMDGELYRWDHLTELRLLARGFGYDVVPIAVYADGTYGLSGYAGTGYTRVTRDGASVWRSDLRHADLLPTVSRAQHAAVGSINERCSALFDPDGARVATYDAAAVFAEAPDGDWIALAQTSLARLAPDGTVRWRRPRPQRGSLRWGAVQPLVDPHGTIYVTDDRSIASYDQGGEQLDACELGAPPGPLFPIAEGRLATVVDDDLVVVA